MKSLLMLRASIMAIESECIRKSYLAEAAKAFQSALATYHRICGAGLVRGKVRGAVNVEAVEVFDVA